MGDCDSSDRPMLSIITVAYENPEELEETLESVRKKWIRGSVEQIVVDGSRSSRCVPVINNNDWIERCIYEQDRGKYDAMNKGVRLSRGSYILFLNSGDHLLEQCDMGGVLQELSRLEKPRLVYGDVVIAVGERLYLRKAPRSIGTGTYPRSGLPSHQATFYPGDYLRRTKYASNMHVSADTQLTLKALKNFEAYYLGYPIALFSLGGISNVKSSTKGVLNHWKESIVAREKNAVSELPRLGKDLLKHLLIRVLGWRIYYRMTFSLRPHVFKPFRDGF